MESSSSFDAKWFWRIKNEPEGPFLDFKRDWKGMLQDQSKKSNLIRHLIAFGNVAYRTRMRTCIVFGVENGTRDVYDLSGIYPGTPPPDAGYANICLATLMTDYVQNQIQREMENWIYPEVPDFDIEFGPVNNAGIEKLVAWWVIKPGNFVYSLKKSICHRGHQYKRGTIFIRKGSNSVPIDPSQEEIFEKLRISPYLDGRAWKNLIINYTSGEFEKVYQFRPYIPPRCKNIDSDAEKALLEAIEKNKRIIILQGNAGTGKSHLIRRAVYQCAKKNIDETTQSLIIARNKFAEHPNIEKRDEEDIQPPVKDFIQELEVLPTYPVPLFFSLRTAFESISRLKVQIGNSLMEVLNYKSENIPERRLSSENFLDGLFAVPGSRWILFLDGLDELFKPEQSAEIGSWIEHELPQNVQVVIATRPNIENFYEDQFLIQIAPLRFSDIFTLTRQRIALFAENQNLNREQGQNAYKELIQWFRRHPGVLEILRIHRALTSFTEMFFSNVTIPKPEIDKEQIRLKKRLQHNTLSYETPEGNTEVKPYTPDELTDLETSESKDNLSADQHPDDLVNSEPLESEENTSANQQDESLILLPPEAIALRNISKYMREEEIKRKPWIPNVKRLDNEARLWLEKTAWESDWSRNQLDEGLWQNNYKEKLIWNENIGFLQRRDYRTLAFICPLYQHYAAAEFACRSIQREYELSRNDEYTAIVRALCEELRSFSEV